MKKRSLLVCTAAVLLFSSCKEKGPIIDFGKGGKATDTTYTAPVETAQAKNIIVEEFTGASCSNCPAARDLLNTVITQPQNAGHVFVMGIHIFNYVQSDPVPGIHTHDFRTQDGTDIGNNVYGSVTAMPIAGIDRVPVSGEMLLLKNVWSSAITSRISVTPPANLTLTSSYDDASRKATIKIKVAYTQVVPTQQYLSLAIMEDSLVDAQEYPSYIDTFYTFNHVLRDFITPTGGSPILSGITIDKGRVYERTFTYTVDEAWKPEHCKLVAFLHNYGPSDKEILQAAETELK